jgi:hypothetical protein
MPGELPALADLDVLGDTDELRAQAEAALRSAEVEPSGTYRAGEPTGSIQVTVDHRGRLVDVRITQWWADRLAPDAFADTVFGLYTAAVRTALLAELSTEDDDRPPRTRPAPPGPELSLEDVLERARATIADNDAKLAALRRAEPVRDDEFELRSEHGYVTLHLRGASPVGLTANAGVLGYANTGVLREDVLAVFADAGLTAGE